jgi:hypothetical protein
MKLTKEVSGIVRAADGAPIEGVLVMGADLNYSETDSAGRFHLKRPEMALFFWCTGFRPETHLLTGRDATVEMVLQPVAVMRASA